MGHHRRTRSAVVATGVTLLLWGLLWGAAAAAEVLVIGHPGIRLSGLSEERIRDLYLGKVVQLPDGSRAEIVDLPGGHPVRDEFYEKVIGKNASQIKAYWAKRVFTGKGSPPDVKSSEAAVVAWVAAAPGRIGYVSPAALNDSVKVLLRKD